MPHRRLALFYFLTLAVIFLLGFLYAVRIPATYTTNALMIAKEQAGGGQQMSGLASATRLLGLSAGGDQSSNFSKFQKYWGSRDVAEQMLRRHPGLLRRLYASEWNKKTNNWYTGPHSLRQWVAVPLNAMFGVYPGYAPTAQDVADLVKGGMKLDVDDLTGEVHVQYSNPDPQFARWFLGTVISETDEAVRAAEERRDQDFINFAHDRLEKEANVSYRDALTDSVRQFEISNMYSEAGANFSFQYVEAPFLPTVHSAPRPLFYTVLALIFANLVAGCLTGIMILWPGSTLPRLMDLLVNRLLERLPPPLGQRRAI
jgi:hypothetical protein